MQAGNEPMASWDFTNTWAICEGTSLPFLKWQGSLCNTEPVSDAGPDLAITKYDQNTTVIEGTASDPDGDQLQFRWLKEGTALPGWDWQDVGEGGEAYLDLSTLDPFDYGVHTLALEVSDGEDVHSDDMELKILSPIELIEDILDFFEESVSNGDLEGTGFTPNMADRRLNRMRNLLEGARISIEQEKIQAACIWLTFAYLRCDDNIFPLPDFVQGDAKEELVYMITELIVELGC